MTRRGARQGRGEIADALGGSGTRYPVGRGVRTLVNVRPLLPDFVYDRLSGIFSR